MASFILNSTDATASTTVDGNHMPATVKVVHLPEAPSTAQLYSLADLCSSHLSNGYSVAVVGCTLSKEFNWNRDDVRMLLGGRV